MTTLGNKDVRHPGTLPPDLIEGTPQEKAELARNLAALRPRQTLYLKITAHCPIEADDSAAFLSAVDALEAACETAKVEAKIDVTVTPPSEATEKHAADKRAKREQREEAERQAKLEAERQAKLKPLEHRPGAPR